MIAQLLRGPHSLYRRYQGLLEQALTATGFALLVALTLDHLAVYPNNWVVVIGVGLAVLGTRWPAIAYVIAVTVMLYPIYTINLYLAVLFFAVAALGHRLCIHYLGATTLVLATPLLAEWHLHWLVPVLGGLWWGGMSGAWVGCLAAMWGKVINGMADLDIDWLMMAGQAPNPLMIANRFQEANSLETLLLLVEPFAGASNEILYHLLQVVGWGVTGGLVGWLAWRKWVKYQAPWSVLVVTAAGGLIMLVTHIGLPYWLPEALSERALTAPPDPVAPLFSLLVVIVVGTTVYSLRESLDLPVAPKRSLWVAPRKKQQDKRRAFSFFKRSPKPQPGQSEGGTEEMPTGEDFTRPRRPVRVPHHSELPEWEPPKNESGLIMLEID